MLEFKNTSVSLANGELSTPFSLVVEDGDVVCFCGGHGSGKSLLLKAILGLSPISKGFITFDGELITPGSSPYFRKMIAYIPQNLPSDKISVAELFRNIVHLQVNSQLKADKKALLEIWEKLGLDKSLLDKTLDVLDKQTKELIMLSVLPLLNRKIVLIDGISQNERNQAILESLASSGTEVLYTCNENLMNCNKIVNL